MAAQTYEFTGKAAWAKVFEGNRENGDFGEFTSINLTLDDESFEKFQESGCRLQPVKEKYRTFGSDKEYRFRRMWTNDYVEEWGGAPDVEDEHGNVFDQLIGNGSKVRITVTVYDTKIGKGHRLEKVTVLDHVPYEMKKKKEPETTKESETGSEARPF